MLRSHPCAPDTRRLQERLLLEQARDTEDGLTANLYWSAPSAAASSLVAECRRDRMDLNRVKYLLRAYLRVRLAKARRLSRAACCQALTAGAAQIEEHVLHTIKEEELFARLSPQEQEFAKG